MVGFAGQRRPNREFPVDMGGFAFAARMVNGERRPVMPYKATFEEDGFLRSMGIE